MPRTTESPFNFALGEVLRTKHPRWREPDRIVAEATGTVQGEPGLRPDPVVLSENGLPVVVETEFAPAHTVEQDAVQRLAKRLQRTGEKIEQALAVRVPQGLATASQHELDRRIREKSNLL